MAAKLPEARPLQRRWVRPAIIVAAFGLLFAFFPPFRVVSLNAPSSAGPGAPVFDPAAFAASYWEERLQPASQEHATDLATLLRDLRDDAAAARATHARTVGIGGRAYYFVRGSGRIVTRERNLVIVEPDGVPSTRVALRIGPVFGNTVRDSTGLLEVNDFPGLTEFNAIAAELNRLVEERVLPPLQAGLPEGTYVTFAGAVEVPGTLSTDPAAPLLAFTPVRAEVH